jgi:hypothetical protein
MERKAHNEHLFFHIKLKRQRPTMSTTLLKLNYNIFYYTVWSESLLSASLLLTVSSLLLMLLAEKEGLGKEFKGLDLSQEELSDQVGGWLEEDKVETL